MTLNTHPHQDARAQLSAPAASTTALGSAIISAATKHARLRPARSVLRVYVRIQIFFRFLFAPRATFEIFQSIYNTRDLQESQIAMSAISAAETRRAKFYYANLDAHGLFPLIDEGGNIDFVIDRMEGLAIRLDNHGWRQYATQKGKRDEQIGIFPKKFAAWRHASPQAPWTGRVPPEHSLLLQRIHDLAAMTKALENEIQYAITELRTCEVDFDAWLASDADPPPPIPPMPERKFHGAPRKSLSVAARNAMGGAAKRQKK